MIVFGGPVTLGDLARAEQVRPPTMTRIVHALEDRKLVTRTPDSADGRSFHITATQAGKTLLHEGRERRVRVLAAQLAGLPPEDRKTIRQAAQLLSEIVRAL